MPLILDTPSKFNLIFSSKGIDDGSEGSTLGVESGIEVDSTGTPETTREGGESSSAT